MSEESAWRTLLGAEGLGAYVDDLAPLVRPALRLVVQESDGEGVGHSRLGGRPDLPPDLEWPRYRDLPLGFVAQVRLADLPPGPARALLPDAGHLWFFYVADQSTWGFDPKDAGSARVLFHPGGGPLAPAQPPEDLPSDGAYDPCALGFVAYEDLPELPLDHPIAARMTDTERKRYSELRFRVASGGLGASHKLLGHAQPVQDLMELECALVTGGLYCGDPSGYADPRAAALGLEAERWRLLLQVDTEDRTSMMWGDTGMLYFWIRDDDLQARRFDRTWTILQCC